MKTQIRKATADDLKQVQEIAARTIISSYSSFLGEEAVRGWIQSGASEKYLEDHLDLARIIEADGKLAGFAVCKNNLIDLMMIDSSLHRQGLGSVLLSDCESRLFQEYDELKLESFEPNKQANDFYKKNGWEAGEVFQEEGVPVKKIAFRKTGLRGSDV